jgi:hypothetical protein
MNFCDLNTKLYFLPYRMIELSTTIAMNHMAIARLFSRDL